MPEGHTIHRLAREHRRLLRGVPLAVSSPQGRFAAGAARLDGATLTGTDAYGKHLYHRYRTTGGELLRLHVHLGLAGKFFTGSGLAPAPTGAVRLRVQASAGWLDLRGPNACELHTPADQKALYARLGADPLRPDADPDAAYRRISRSRVPVGQLLMDQSVVAGVGNIYRAEILFRHGISPYRPGHDLPADAWARLWPDLVTLMRAGVRTGRIDTVRPEHEPRAMGRPPRVDAHGGEVYVYRRAGQPCHVCRSEVRVAEMAARNLFWCPTCQPC
ncbi:Fpg/Nei family DNA glycosylase [Actinocatenispora sera]|uniref:DNA-(apurinic or apyrimidinic site) lyase n=1 Tax=Actinocatenispora sera TaxID=390989 RepID=A0A810L9V9_9ACTN|nr:DNA-formamidopyrimidine glycosylase family protein [Actinocatenispora sera]BCJ32069.1 endonuclease VIII [Actinocatenispora sera]